jgi:hypothetical protein
MGQRRLPVAFLLTAFAVLALVAATPAAAASADAPAGGAADGAACTPTALVQVCVWSPDCITVDILGHPFAIIGCS